MSNENEAQAPRPRPAPVKRQPSVYLLYAEAEEGVLHPLLNEDGQNEWTGNAPEDAIGNWSDANPDESLEGVVFVPIAKRNFTRVAAQVTRAVKLAKVDE